MLIWLHKKPYAFGNYSWITSITLVNFRLQTISVVLSAMIQAGETRWGLVVFAEKLQCWNNAYLKIIWCSNLVIVPRNNEIFE